MSLLKVLGNPAYLAQRSRGLGATCAAWFGTAGVLFLYFTDWKVVMGKVPYIKDKYEYQPPK